MLLATVYFLLYAFYLLLSTFYLLLATYLVGHDEGVVVVERTRHLLMRVDGGAQRGDDLAEEEREQRLHANLVEYQAVPVHRVRSAAR